MTRWSLDSHPDIVELLSKIIDFGAASEPKTAVDLDPDKAPQVFLMLAAVRKKCEKEYGWTNDKEPRKQRFGRRGRRRR